MEFLISIGLEAKLFDMGLHLNHISQIENFLTQVLAGQELDARLVDSACPEAQPTGKIADTPKRTLEQQVEGLASQMDAMRITPAAQARDFRTVAASLLLSSPRSPPVSLPDLRPSCDPP